MAILILNAHTESAKPLTGNKMQSEMAQKTFRNDLIIYYHSVRCVIRCKLFELCSDFNYSIVAVVSHHSIPITASDASAGLLAFFSSYHRNSPYVTQPIRYDHNSPASPSRHECHTYYFILILPMVISRHI